MNPILISPQITSDKPIAEQLQQMKSYLFRFKEEVELLLSNIDSDNLSEKFEDDFSKIVGSKIMGSNEMSQIIQSAGQIKLSVEALDSSVASLTLTTNGIYNQINDPDNGILTELSIVSGQVVAAVKFGVNYSGFKITSNKVHLFTTGALQIDSGNFKVDSSGNVEVTGKITAKSGTIAGLDIDEDGLYINGYKEFYRSGQYLYIGGSYGGVKMPGIIEMGGVDGDVMTIETLVQIHEYCLMDEDCDVTGNLGCGTLEGYSISWEDIDTVVGTGAYVLVGTP